MQYKEYIIPSSGRPIRAIIWFERSPGIFAKGINTLNTFYLSQLPFKIAFIEKLSNLKITFFYSESLIGNDQTF